MPLVVALAAAVLVGVLTAVARVVLHVRARHPSPDEVAERTGLRALVRHRLGPLEVSGLALAVTVVGLGLAVGAFGFAAIQATRTSLWWVDASMARWGSQAAVPGSTAGLRLLTWLGATVTVSAVALVAGLADAWRRVRLGRRPLDGILFLLLVVLGQNLIANAVKLVVARARPPVPPLAAESGYSFPSGHTAAATATAVALALIIGQRRARPVRVLLAGMAATVATAVAASRVLLGVHWVSDVIGGAAIGLVWVAVVTFLFGGRRLELGAELAGAELEADAGRVARPPTIATIGGAMSQTEPEQTPPPDQVHSRAAELAAEPKRGDDPEREAEVLLEESEERIGDPAARNPGDGDVIRRASDEGVQP